MRKQILAIVILWLAIVSMACSWSIIKDKRYHEQLAYDTARAFFQQILVTRAWNAGHGGIYVPVTNEVRPNPYLADPLRDLNTNQGVHLTKINPAYMTRQIAELSARSEENAQIHTTSLNPLRPLNSATDWEKQWLKSFEKGSPEQGGFVGQGNNSFFRYMAPLKVEEACLKCHAEQGYKIGDIRGGISITLPKFSKTSPWGLIVGYGIAALAGTIFTIIGGAMVARKREELLVANNRLKKEVAARQKTIDELLEAQKEIKVLSGIIPICMHCKEIRDDEGFWNQLEHFLDHHTEAQFSHSICEKCLEKHYPEVVEQPLVSL